jgi:L-ascorbate metabolism protein UlaG (beta-lactamase superfamily)
VRPESIAWSRGELVKSGAPSREPVRVTWLGTAGFSIAHAGYTVLFDPYITRASLLRCAAMPLVSDRDAIMRHVPRADAIVVGHTHFDHVLDVPFIARATGARVFGSRSAVTLCRSEGVPASQVEDVERAASGEPIVREVGPFRLRFIPSAHSRFAFGRVPAAGEITDCDDVPMRLGQYKCGAVFGVEISVAGKTLFHMGSAELVDANLDVKNVDLLLMCVAGWTSSRNLPERVAQKLAPSAVLLSHWDDFFRPIDRPARALPAMKLPQLVERLSRAARDVKVGTLPIFGHVEL